MMIFHSGFIVSSIKNTYPPNMQMQMQIGLQLFIAFQ